jgi:glycosyltransferase involved in cell wall biosynthesis
MAFPPKVSVIVPVYNIEPLYLTVSITSLLEQSLTEIEIILVDDKSHLNISNLLDDFAKKDSRVTIIHKTRNERTGFARNTGLDFVTGEYTGFLDHDDIAHRNLFFIAYQEAKDGDFTIVSFMSRNFRGDETYKSIPEYISPQTNYDVEIFDENFFNTVESIHVYPWNKIYKSNFIINNKLKFPNMTADEDVIFLYQYYPYVKDSIKKLRNKLIFRRKRKESVSSRLIPIRYRIFEIIKNFDNAILKWEKDGMIKEENIKKIMNVFYAFANRYNHNNPILKKIILNYLSKKRKLFNERNIKIDKKHINFWNKFMTDINDTCLNDYIIMANGNNFCLF